MRWVVVVLLGLVGSWMTFDGSRALVVGDYVTPTRGVPAGELGPWSKLVERVGIPARSTAMKVTFVIIGLVHLSAVLALVVSTGTTSGWLVVVSALTGLWYLPFGTIADGAALAIVLFSSLRPW